MLPAFTYTSNKDGRNRQPTHDSMTIAASNEGHHSSAYKARVLN